MSRRTRTRSTVTILIAALVACAVASSPIVAARGPVQAASAPTAGSADIQRALGPDGTFRGASGVAGSVDTAAWALVSDLASGEAPRFAPAGGVSPAATGPWTSLGSDGHGNGALNNDVNAFAFSGSNLYVGGRFTNAAGLPRADYLAKWNGSAWSALGSNGHGNGALNGDVNALTFIGTVLYAGGDFTNAAGKPKADHVAKWDGTTWSALGSDGLGHGALTGYVLALDHIGSNLYVGGYFTDAGGHAEADYIARWNGTAWAALGSNGSGDGALSDKVTALTVSGSNLYVGGLFQNIGGDLTANYVARWDGAAWHALGSNGFGGSALNDNVYALVAVGVNLYAGGVFTDAQGIPEADYVARWDGVNWFALGSNGAGDGALNSYVYALAVSMERLYVGGNFTDAANNPRADSLAVWDGSHWSAVGSNGSGNGALNQDVFVLAASLTHVYVGGRFTNAAGIAKADYVAGWRLRSTLRVPDGRIRLGTGPYVGNNVYNTTGASQSRAGSAARGHMVTFGISIQNDGNAAGRFKVKATGSAAGGYTVKYFQGTTDITPEVVAGTYRTPSLAPGATYLITAKVMVKQTAGVGSQVVRLVTITSVGSPTIKDAVKFIGKRA